MPRKPLDQLSPAYRRRVEAAEAKGKSRQAARGHKAREHVIRHEKELQRQRETGDLTSRQRQAVREWLRGMARRVGQSPEGMVDAWDGEFQQRGWDWFKRVRMRQAALRKEYERRNYPIDMIGDIDVLEDMAAENDAESWMLFYH